MNNKTIKATFGKWILSGLLLILSIALLSFTFSKGILSEKPKKQKRPNIVFIMSDEHAYQAISAYSAQL